MAFLHTREWEKIGKEEQKKREAQRVTLLKKDANPNPDYRLPHMLLEVRGEATKPKPYFK